VGEKRLTVRAIKRLIDGALGARSAWLLEPYADFETSAGFSTLVHTYADYDASARDGSLEPAEYIAETAKIAIENGFQLCTHAIGDRAVRETLDIYQRTFQGIAHARGLRWRVEHASVIAPRDIPRFGQMGVIASMQAISCTSDGAWMIERLGETRARERAFAFQQLIKSGATVINGTDVPVEDVDPLPCFYAAVTCELPDGTVFWPDERMTREQALRAYTLSCAYAAHEETIKGLIAPGKLADLVVLSQDIMTVPAEEILNTEVLTTILGGEVVYQE
jgi:predicted amidohydrolase YtcJ